MNISKSYKRIKSHNDRDRSKLYITPFREWSIMLFLSTIILIVVVFFCYRAFDDIYINSFEENGIVQMETDPYKIEDLKVELSKTLQYYKGLEDEHNALLGKQPLFENKINIVKSSDVFVPQDSVEGLEEDKDDNMDVSTEGSESPLEEEPILEVFDHIRSNISNTASVLKVFFIDPCK